MTKITDRYTQEQGRPLFVCDFSPPRGAGADSLEPARHLNADWISLAYNPGKAVRVNAAIAAHWVKASTGRDVVFTLATRDMNKVAVQSLLLGAELLGLENVVVVKGDNLNERDLSSMKGVNDYTPTGLLRSINDMNQSVDFKGLKLRSPTHFCAGATIDMGRNLEREVQLTRRKIEAGAQFFISQPVFRAEQPRAFLARYAEQYGEEVTTPIFYGLQIMAKDSLVFGDVPEWVTDDLDKGRTGADIALQVLSDFTGAGLRAIYLIPPILRGGRRDYNAAQAVLEDAPR
jgi:5,10-methylenetetrahydrofolate reductase